MEVYRHFTCIACAKGTTGWLKLRHLYRSHHRPCHSNPGALSSMCARRQHIAALRTAREAASPSRHPNSRSKVSRVRTVKTPTSSSSRVVCTITNAASERTARRSNCRSGERKGEKGRSWSNWTRYGQMMPLHTAAASSRNAGSLHRYPRWLQMPAPSVRPQRKQNISSSIPNRWTARSRHGSTIACSSTQSSAGGCSEAGREAPSAPAGTVAAMVQADLGQQLGTAVGIHTDR